MSKFFDRTRQAVHSINWTYVSWVAGITLVIVGLVYYGFLRVNHSEYSEAYDNLKQTISLYNDYIAIQDDILGSDIGAPKDDFMTLRSKYKTTFDTYIKSADSFMTKQVLRDDSVDGVYTKLVKKNTELQAIVKSNLDKIVAINDVTRQCKIDVLAAVQTTDLATLKSLYDSAVRPCLDALQSASEDRDSMVADKANQALEYLDSLNQLVSKLDAAYSAGDRDSFSQEYQSFKDSVGKFSSEVDMRNLAVVDASAMPTDILNELATLLESKAK